MNEPRKLKRANKGARLAVLATAVAALLLACRLTAPAGQPAPTFVEATVEPASPTPPDTPAATGRPTATAHPTNTPAPSATPTPTPETRAPETGTPAAETVAPPVEQSEILERWEAPIAAGTYLATGCEAALNAAELRARGAINAEEAGRRQTGAAFILSAAQVSLDNWEAPPELAGFEARLRRSQQDIRAALVDWGADRERVEAAAVRLGEVCPEVRGALQEVIAGAGEAGLSEASLAAISEGIRAQLEDMGTLNEAMGATPTPEVRAASQAGRTRKDPLDGSGAVQVPGWQLRVSEVISGSAALEKLEEAGGDPPALPEGWTALLVRVQVTNTQSVPARIVPLDFGLTGSRGVRYGRAPFDPPGPFLDARVEPEEGAEGWLAYRALEDESDRMLVYDPFIDFDPAKTRFIALEPGGSISPPEELPEPNDLGISPDDPAPPGETVVTGEWAVTIEQALRGEAAAERVRAADMGNPPAPDGREYLALRIRARALGEGDRARLIDRFSFRLLDRDGEPLDLPSVRSLFPALDVFLFPGGEFTGWVVLLAPDDLEDPVVLFSPWNTEAEARRYLAVEAIQ